MSSAPQRPSALHRSSVLGALVGVLLVALHLDFWREQRVVLYFGWVPEELLYRLVWMLAAWVFLLWLCAPRRSPAGADDEGDA